MVSHDHLGGSLLIRFESASFLGVGRVAGTAVPARDFKLKVDGEEKPALEVLGADYHREFAHDDDKSEYFVPVVSGKRQNPSTQRLRRLDSSVTRTPHAAHALQNGTTR